MAEPIPTTKVETAAQETRAQLDQIKRHHDAAEAAADRGAALEEAGDRQGAQEAYDRADAENDSANEIADVVQAKVGTNHTVNGDGTITRNKVGGDKFDDTAFTRQETVIAESGLTAEQVALAGPEALDEAIAVVEHNKAEAADRAAEDFVDSLLEDASIDPDLATEEDVVNVLDREVMRQDGILDLVESDGGDPDTMSPEELEDAAVAAVEKEVLRQDGILDLIEEQGGDPDTMSPEELEEAAVRAVEAEADQQSTEPEQEEPPMSREPDPDAARAADPSDGDQPTGKEGHLWDLLDWGDGSAPPKEDVENNHDTPQGVDGDGGGKPGESAGRGSTEGTPGGDQAEPPTTGGVAANGPSTGTTTAGGSGSGAQNGKSPADAVASESGSGGTGAARPVTGVTGTTDEGGKISDEGVPSAHEGDELGDGPRTGRGDTDAEDPLGDGGLGFDRGDVGADLGSPHLGGRGGMFDDPLGAGSAPDGSGFGDSFGGSGGPSDAPSGAEGLLGRLPDDATPGSGGGGLPGSGNGQGGGTGTPGVPGGKAGEDPLADWDPGTGGGGGRGGGGGTAPAAGGGTSEPGGETGGSGGPGGVDSGAGAPSGGGAPGGDGGGSPSDDPGGDSGMVLLGNFWYSEVDGQEGGGAYDTYVDDSGNVYVNGPNGLELVNDDDAAKIDEKLETETGKGVDEYAEEAAAAAAEAAAAAAAEAEEEEDSGDAAGEDYAEPPPMENPYRDDPLLNEYIQQEVAAEAGGDIDYGDQVGGLADAATTVDVRPDQVDYGGSVVTPADPDDVPMEQAQGGLIDPSPMDDPVYGSGQGGPDQQSEIENKLKESQSGSGGSDDSDGGGAAADEAAFGAGAGETDAPPEATHTEADPGPTPDDALAELMRLDDTIPTDALPLHGAAADGLGQPPEPDPVFQDDPVRETTDEPTGTSDDRPVADDEPARDAFEILDG